MNTHVTAKAICRLGAASPGGLALPLATPTPSQMYAPRGVFFDGNWLVVADSGNHRILLWHGLPNNDGQPADVVLGQPNFYSEGPRKDGLHLPTGVAIHDGRLLVADSWHHRILVWDRVPTVNNAQPDHAIGQPDMVAIEPNQGGDARADTLYWPYSFGFCGDWFYIADTGNRRVLGWHGLPLHGEKAELILGQPDESGREENRGGPVSARSFRWPHAIAGNEHTLYVADAGNHRVLGWDGLPENDRDADLVLGQQSFTTAIEFPYAQGGQGPAAMRFPYCLALEDKTLAVADTANNRVLLWENLPRNGVGLPATGVIGQPDFKSNGENHWKSILPSTLCWPYGLAMHGSTLVVADSGNNRATIWEVAQDADHIEEETPEVCAVGDR
jgi:hypothetical protein